jgi:hypothetical protein
MRETVYYFLVHLNTIATKQKLELWQLFTNVKRLDREVCQTKVETRENELKQLWESVALSRQPASDADETPSVPSNSFQALDGHVDIAPVEAFPAARLKTRGGCGARGGQSGGSVRAPSIDAQAIRTACEVIRPMFDGETGLVESVGGFSSDGAAFKNPTSLSNPEKFKTFMDAIPAAIRESREDAIAFLQKASLISSETTIIQSKNNRTKKVYLFLAENGEALMRKDTAPPASTQVVRAEFTSETATAVAVSSDEFVPNANAED